MFTRRGGDEVTGGRMDAATKGEESGDGLDKWKERDREHKERLKDKLQQIHLERTQKDAKGRDDGEKDKKELSSSIGAKLRRKVTKSKKKCAPPCVDALRAPVSLLVVDWWVMQFASSLPGALSVAIPLQFIILGSSCALIYSLHRSAQGSRPKNESGEQ